MKEDDGWTDGRTQDDRKRNVEQYAPYQPPGPEHAPRDRYEYTVA